MGDCGDLVVDGDPTLPLVSIAHSATEPELEERELLPQRPALRGEDDAGAKVNRADAGGLGCCGGRLPALAHSAEEVGARRRQLIEALVASVAVPADC